MRDYFSTYPSFGSILPYRDFNQANEVFILGERDKKERYVGGMWEYAAFVDEANALSGQKLAIANLIESALLQIPEGYAFQFMVDSDRNVSAYLPPVPDLDENSTNFDILHAEQIAFLHKSSKFGLWDKRSIFPRTLRFRIFIFNAPRKITIGERSVSKIERVEIEDVSMDINKQMATFNSKISIFEAMLRNHGFPLFRRNAQYLINYFHQYMHKNLFKNGLGAPAWIPEVDLSDQMLRTFVSTDDRYVYSDGHYYRSTAAIDAPQYTVPGIMYKLFELPGDIHICLAGYMPIQDKEKSALKWKGNFASYGIMNPFGREDNNNSAILKDIDRIEKAMLNNIKLFHFSLIITSVGETFELADNYAKKIQAKIPDLEMKVLADNIVGQSLFKTSLPFHYAPLDNKNHLARTFKLPSDHFSHLVPATGAWHGTDTPGIIGLARTVEPVYLDPFDGNPPHFLVSGDTGTGKSALLNLLTVMFRKRGDRFFILDPMNSFEKLCRIGGGSYISFDLNSPVSYNPLNCELSNETLLLISNFLTSIMSRKNDELSQADIVLLDKAVVATFEMAKDYNDYPELEDFYNVLRKHFGERGLSLSERLVFYVGNGKYSRFFRKSTFDVDNPLVVFALGGLKEAPDLMNAMLLNIMLLVGEKVKKLPGRKWMPIDEIHQILDDSGAGFVETAFRTYRHYGTAVGALTQKVSDPLSRGRVGEVILTQPNLQIYFRQPSQSVLDAIGYLELSEPDAYAIEKLESKMGFYSEAFIHMRKLRKGGAGKGVIRFVSTPLNYAAFTTDPPDKDVYNPIKADIEEQMNGSSDNEIEMATVRAFAEMYPHGVIGSSINPSDIW